MTFSLPSAAFTASAPVSAAVSATAPRSAGLPAIRLFGLDLVDASADAAIAAMLEIGRASCRERV